MDACKFSGTFWFQASRVVICDGPQPGMPATTLLQMLVTCAINGCLLLVEVCTTRAVDMASACAFDNGVQDAFAARYQLLPASSTLAHDLAESGPYLCCQPTDHVLLHQSSSRPEVLIIDCPSVPDNMFDHFVHRPLHRPALQMPRRLCHLWLKGTVRWEHVKPVWQAQLLRGEGGGTLQGVACRKPPHGCVVPRVGEAHRGCRAVDLQQVCQYWQLFSSGHSSNPS